MNNFTRRDFIQHTAALTGGLGCAAIGDWAAAADSPGVGHSELASQLKGKLKGQLVRPGDAAYEQARKTFYWNPKTARQPAAIVQCAHEDDVVRALEFAREASVEVAIRSGGHSHLGWGTTNGLVIDLSQLKRISVDPERRIVQAQAGCTSGEVARAAAEHGLVPVLGQCPGVSAIGVTLGGGLGWLSGLFGACCDNLLSARLVTAGAKVLDVSAETDPELFWGLQGAGANFGATTSFTARLHPLGKVFGGDIHFPVSDTRVVMRGFRELMHDAPDGFQATLNLTPGDRGVFISLCRAGDEREWDELLGKIRAIAKPFKEAVRHLPFADLAEKAAATNPGNTPQPAFRAIQTVYRDQITDDIIDIYVDQLSRAKPDLVLGLSHYMHGQVCRIAPDATAFPHRAAHSIHLRAAYNWSDPKTNEERFAWGEEWLKLLRPTTNERLYANYQTYDTKSTGRALFTTNHARLLALKTKHDPANVFCRNANIAAG